MPIKINPTSAGRKTRPQGYSLTPEQIEKVKRVATHLRVNASTVIQELIDQLDEPPKKQKRSNNS